MGFRTFRRIRVLAVSLTTASAATTLFAIAGTAGPVAAATSTGCPRTKTASTVPTASNVTAGFSNSGNVSTYTFTSLKNEDPVGGVPGLIKYCIYPAPKSSPTGITVTAHGDNGALWLSGTGKGNFAFVRPGGNKSNIGLDGSTTTMGTATWATLPAGQTIVLHINDPAACAKLYPGSTSATCFVKPSPGPICDAGQSTVAYNAMPFGVVNCLNPAIGFEATSTNEFGDAVSLQAGTGRTLSSLIVDFQSYACESGHWYTGDCVSTPGDTFQVPGGITAKIYATDSTGTTVGTELASATINPNIPYRPSASGATICPSTGGGQWTAGSLWFNPDAPNGGACQTSIADKLVFNFTGNTTLPDYVIWTVQFSTSTSGYSPLGTTSACNTGPGGGPYDSLNVGDKTYPGAPYAGADLNEDQVVISQGGTAAPLQVQSGWSGFRPLGEIITTP